MKLQSLLGIFTFAVVFLVHPMHSANAQVSYSVTPRVIDVTAEARDIITKTITITNNSGTSYTSIFPSVNEIDVAADGDISDFRGPTQVERTAAITSWIELPRKEVRIAPGASQDITMTIRMNPNTQSGEYHALLGFGSGRIRADAEAQVADGRAPTIVVTIRVADTAVERMDLEGFAVDRFVTSDDNQAARYTLTNPGDTTVVPEGEIVFYDTNGRELGSIDANPEKLSLQPGEEVEVKTTVPTKGLGGRHKAFLNVNYGAAQVGSVYDTAFFYVIPWQKLLLIFLVIAIFAITLTVYLYKRYGINDDDDGAEYIPLRVKEDKSDSQEHDIDLKQSA